MNSMTIERIQQIHDFAEGSNPSEVMNLSAGEIALLTRIALDSRKAVPVAWTDEQELRSVQKDGCGYLFKANPVSPHSDPRRVIMVYAAPPARIVADLCAAIEALLDMQVRMVKQTNVGASFFDGETISAMNYAPIQAKQALELAKPYK